jgi:GTPase SAR1 family protein/nucleotide-binding universal stress UspA family protein
VARTALTPILAFHPRHSLLATHGSKRTELRVWDIDATTAHATGSLSDLTSPMTEQSAAPPGVSRTIHYTNAKVVLVGDASVGKSGLGLVLSGQPFVPTLSTHGRNVWLFESQKAELGEDRSETRETLLWDLAGQPGYRLVHQLHLNEVAVALVVFDAQSETDPLAGVRHWCRALRQALRIQGHAAPPLKQFLVAARVDRGNVSVSQARIEALLQSHGFDGFFKTSAKEGWKIPELAEAIRGAINWDSLPKVSSNELFERIKAFLLTEKESGRTLSSRDDLYRLFLKSEPAPPQTPELHDQFEMCIGRVESRGLIRRLSFGGLVLLQPELLDAYASALVNAAKDEPDGLGSIAEEVARSGSFPMPKDERVKDPAQEKLLLIAVVEDLLHHEIALREQAEGGPYLTFPSQLTREMPDLQDLKGKAGVLRFEGPVLNIYATLVVRLSHSNWFQKKELWRNAAAFTTKAGGTYGLALRELEEGQGELTLFYDEAAGPESRFQFEEYILTHLQRRALPDTLSRRRILTCAKCQVAISDEQATRRLALGHHSMQCPVCDAAISLQGLVEQLPASVAPRIEEMDQGADERRDAEKAVATIEGKTATNDFDVFLSYNSQDRKEVLAIAERLKEKGILPWLDIWQSRPGTSWQKTLEKQLKKLKAAAVFIGHRGLGPWQDQEIEALLQRLVKKKCTVIPVLLEAAPKQPKLPLFLEALHRVDFRQKEPDPLKQLIWGITSERRE